MMPAKSSDKSRPKDLMASEIRALRKKKGLSRAALGMLIGVSPMTIFRWETEVDRPVPKHLMEMGKLATEDRRWLFFERAGISRDQIAQEAETSTQPVSVGFSVSAPAGASRSKFEKSLDDVVAVRVLKDSVAAGNPRFINENDIESFILVPNSKEFAPHPSSLIAVKIKGDSMSPFLDDGYIAVIDTADSSRKHLYNEMVAARDPEGGVTIKWLRNNGRDEILMPQHTAIRHQPMIITGNDDWKIIGKVVWWVGKPPPK